jgi:hypothetical protein
MLPITGCCLLVGDRDRAVEFYTERVGLTLARKAPGFAQYRPRGGTHISTWELAHFCAETGIPFSEPQPLHKAMGGLLLASPAEVDAAYAALRGRGVAFPRPPKVYDWNAYAAYFADPDGNLWELFTWAPGGPPTPELPLRASGRFEPAAPTPGTAAGGSLGPAPSPARPRAAAGPHTTVPVAAICLLCHDVDTFLPFYTDALGFQVRRRDSKSFAQFWSHWGIALCLWEIGHVVEHVGFEAWPRGDTTRKVACTVRCGSREDVDQLYQDLTSHGVRPPHPPRSHPWNAYAFYFTDPDGNCWEIYHWLEGGPGRDEYQMADPATIDRLVRGQEITMS